MRAGTMCISVQRAFWTWAEWIKDDNCVNGVLRLRMSADKKTAVSPTAFESCKTELRDRRSALSTVQNTSGTTYHIQK